MRRGRYGVPMQVYGAIVPGAARVDRLLPRAAKAARTEPSLSRQARQRLKMLHWYEDHGRNARRTCRHFGVRPDTFYRWRRRYQRAGPRGLADRSHRPSQVRQPTWSRELAQAVLQLRKEHPRWGKDKLVVLLRAAGWAVSTSMVGRILRRLKQDGILWEADLRDPGILKRSPARPYAVRKPASYRVE